MTVEYPSKLYYAISEVAKITGVKAHVLRYWESEFPTLRPRKTRSGSRRYRQKDIDEILAIKKLLYEDGFKIAGARKARREQKKAGDKPVTNAPQMALGFDGLSDRERLDHVRKELGDVLEMIRALKEEKAAAPLKTRKANA
ncbi:MAG: MerR family transcriptional regulator [bacterium]|nr:MerR family transcriptional regulator [bacterium]